MDEVLAVGDASFQEKCFDTFNRYKREGKTIVLVSHNLDSLEEYCDRVLLLNHGEVIADGPATEVTSAYHRMVAEHALATAQESSPTALVRGDPNQWGSRAVEFIVGQPAATPMGRASQTLRHGRPDDPRHAAARASRRRRFRVRHGDPSR